MLRLTGESEIRTCPTCRGSGRVRCPATITVRTQGWGDAGYAPFTTPSTGKPIPCPECRGRKVITGPAVDPDEACPLRLTVTE